MDKNLNNQFIVAQNFLNQGNIHQAEYLMLDLVKKNSKVVEFNYFLGLIYINLKKFSDAVRILEKSNKLKKNYEHSNLLLGIGYASLKNFNKALNFFKKELQLYPNAIEPYINLSNLYIEIKDLNLSEYYLTKAKELDSSNFKIFELEGLIFYKQNKYHQALKSFDLAIKTNPNSFGTLFNMAKINEKLFNYEEAKNFYQRALKLNPNSGVLNNDYAFFLYSIGQSNEAYLILKKSWHKFSELEQLKTLEILANISSQNNLINESIEFHELFLLNKIVNDNFMAMLWSYCEIKKIDLNSDILKRAKYIIENEKLNQNQKSYYYFVLADIYKKLDEKDLYSQCLIKANNLLKHYRNYSFSENAIIFKNIYELDKSIYEYDLKENKNIQPIFIVGMPRSGTTLIEQIIASHPEVYGCGEIHLLTEEINKLLIKKDTKLDELKKIKEKYENLVLLKKGNKKFHTDKYPLNFLYINIIIKLFPCAKIINVQRDKKATIFSNYDRYMGDKFGFSCDIDDLNLFYIEYQKLLRYWKKKYPNKIYELNYEKLTLDSKNEIKKLIKFCNLNWNENCLYPEKTVRLIHTPSKLQVRKKIYKDSSQVWKNYADFFPTLDKIQE